MSEPLWPGTSRWRRAAVDEFVELRLCQPEGLGALATPAFTEELEVRIRSDRIADLADAQVDLAVKELVLLVARGTRQRVRGPFSIGTDATSSIEVSRSASSGTGSAP